MRTNGLCRQKGQNPVVLRASRPASGAGADSRIDGVKRTLTRVRLLFCLP